MPTIDHCDSAVQDVCRKLVQHEVIALASPLVSHFVDNLPTACVGDVGEEDITSLLYTYPDHSERIAEIEDEIEEASREASTHSELHSIKMLESEKSDLESEQDNGFEALEHWIVSDWFADKLREKGEIVGELLGFTIWGRTTSGQAICVDEVVVQVAADMEILPGQANDWSK